MAALFVAVGVTGCAGGPGGKVLNLGSVPDAQIIDGQYFSRHSTDETEVLVASNAGGGLVTFCIQGNAVAKLDQGQAIRIYLRPGRYRFGVVPSWFVRGSYWETNAEITAAAQQDYLIFQSSGFTSSGGSAVFEISRVENGVLTKRG